MATEKLLGTDTAGDQYVSPGYVLASQFTCAATGILSEVRVYCLGNSDVRVALYSDNGADKADALLAESASVAVTAGGWRTVSLGSNVNVTAGEKYWPAVQVSAAAGSYWRYATRYMGYATQAYGAFPASGLSWGYVNTQEISLQGYGVLVVTPSSTTQPIAIGSPTVEVGAGGLTIAPSGIAVILSYGTPALLYPQTISPSGISVIISHGTPKLILFIKPSSIVQAISIGSPIVTLPQLYESYAEESAYYNVYGAYWRSQTFTPQSTHKITSVKLKLCRVGSPGTGTISIKAADANGKPTGADLCTGSIDGNALPTDPTLLGFSLGAGTNLSIGTKYAIVWRFPSGDSSNYARTRHKYPGTYAGGTAVTSSDSGATWEVVTDWDFVFEDWGEPLMQTIYPDSIVQPVAYGSPIVWFVGTVYPTSIVQSIAYGIPTILGGIPGGIIWPPSVVQPISVGSPTILKYVWHVVLDGEYTTATPPTNRAYVIGRDVYGNPVYGTAVDSTELGLVGERLDFQQELAVPTSSQAESVANAILSKMRLTGKRGVILIPPNCGQELFDVVQLSDKGANQEAVSFRVVGIRFEYNPKQARYHHKLILGAP